MTSKNLPQNLYTADSVRAMDACAINDHQIPGAVLMKRAGRVCFGALQSHFPCAQTVTVFCGGGNNGGDGYVVAALAQAAGMAVQVIYLSEPMELTGDAQRAYQYALQEGVACRAFTSDYAMPIQGVIVDALLGTGLRGEVRLQMVEVINKINAAGLPVLSVDIPSGLCADTGQSLGAVVQADVTCTFIGLKLGLLTGDGPSLCGQVVFSDLEVPNAVLTGQPVVAQRILLEMLLMQVPTRRKAAHKGDFGHSLIIGGDIGYGGAALMSAEVCARMGSGLTSLATRPENVTAANVRVPEVMAIPITAGVDVEEWVNKATVIAVGPGLGKFAWGEQLLLAALMAQKPLVIDADGLNLIAQGIGGRVLAQRDVNIPLILTPHPGEAARLLKTSNEAVQNDRVAAVKALADQYKATVLLKGAGSLIAGPGTPVTLCSDGNPGMASGGMGDVLTGIIAGLMAQSLAPLTALQLAVTLHAAAADRLAQRHGQRGLLATDLIQEARALINGK
ncbi:NAD(P)H-hydrate dehydratase [Halioxenophilus aromaticivorans]|uniref:Bifunctional NAD(P)H-hydrate repair enzyme n=1 Tax=Halioxenophilus aromaticivorans TaxID=1306992 RepID=A0AAV3U0C2_9ALTE